MKFNINKLAEQSTIHVQIVNNEKTIILECLFDSTTAQWSIPQLKTSKAREFNFYLASLFFLYQLNFYKVTPRNFPPVPNTDFQNKELLLTELNIALSKKLYIPNSAKQVRLVPKEMPTEILARLGRSLIAAAIEDQTIGLRDRSKNINTALAEIADDTAVALGSAVLRVYRGEIDMDAALISAAIENRNPTDLLATVTTKPLFKEMASSISSNPSLLSKFANTLRQQYSQSIPADFLPATLMSTLDTLFQPFETSLIEASPCKGVKEALLRGTLSKLFPNIDRITLNESIGKILVPLSADFGYKIFLSTLKSIVNIPVIERFIRAIELYKEKIFNAPAKSINAKFINSATLVSLIAFELSAMQRTAESGWQLSPIFIQCIIPVLELAEKTVLANALVNSILPKWWQEKGIPWNIVDDYLVIDGDYKTATDAAKVMSKLTPHFPSCESFSTPSGRVKLKIPLTDLEKHLNKDNDPSTTLTTSVGKLLIKHHFLSQIPQNLEKKEQAKAQEAASAISEIIGSYSY